MDRVQIVHENFLRRVASRDLPHGPAPRPGLTDDDARRIFRAQCATRALDRESRAMQARGEGFYTIGSSGHEGLAAVAWALRPTDPAYLHYRDGAFQMARAEQVPGQDMIWDMLLSYACSSEDPISGGRHKVLGSKPLNILPQTSTIASHLPKSVGAAFAIGAARRNRPDHFDIAPDSIVFCSFGDASLNHSTAQGAINTAGWTSVQSTPLPLLFLCEDNGIGISTKTPDGWVETSMRHRPGIMYFSANGLDIYETYETTLAAAAYVRTHRKPAFLHLKTVRLYGHAGADTATSYLPLPEVEETEANDPLLHSVRLLDASGAQSCEASLEVYQSTDRQVQEAAKQAGARPRLASAEEVAASLVPPGRPCRQPNGPSDNQRRAAFGSDARVLDTPQTMGKLINWALMDLMLEHDEILMMGEDIGKKGGVYGVTRNLQAQFGRARVIDTLLDEQSILGLAIGTGQSGFVPIPEIQFLAYLHNAEDQIRGEAATLSFFSNRQYANPMVLRIAGLGYQRGFGGHFHNDNSLAVLRDVPGLIVACPSTGPDAARMLREAVRLAREEQRVVTFVEPIALYPMRDLHEAGDNGWLGTYPAAGERIPVGEVGVQGDGTDLAIVTYGNGHHIARQVQKQLRDTQNADIRVIDIRWISPLPETALLAAAADCRSVLIVDECRRSGNVSEALMTLFAEQTDIPVSRHTATDCFIATGPAYAATLPSVPSVRDAAIAALNGKT